MHKVLIANRGEIACRVALTCRLLQWPTVAVYSEVDAEARHVALCDEAVALGGKTAKESYLNQEALIDACRATGATAIHPGYGFLSENPEFARLVRDAGLIFIGPSPETMALMGSKSASKAAMREAGVPVVPGYHGENQDEAFLLDQAQQVGLPLMIKASAGGGGKGMRICRDLGSFTELLAAAKREAAAAFGDDRMLLEKYIQNPRHIEVQVFGDGLGGARHFFERDCTIQRRHQKVLEESPSGSLSEAQRQAIIEAAVRVVTSVAYLNAGTVEFIVEPDGTFYFLEMNTRLQVEHPVTEWVTGEDLVHWQLVMALEGRFLKEQQGIGRYGHAAEVRIYAEDPQSDFLPQSGQVLKVVWPDHPFLRIDHALLPGQEISVYYDPMLAKLIAFGSNRQEALDRLQAGLRQVAIHGVKTNVHFLIQLLAHPDVRSASHTTHFLEGAKLEDPCQPSADLLAALTALAPAKKRVSGVSSHDNASIKTSPWQSLGPWRVSP